MAIPNDAARKWTDAELEALEKRMAREYSRAAKDMRGKQAEWLEKFDREREQRERALDNTKEALEGHKRWLQSQAARGGWLDGMATQLADSAHQANVRAMDMVNGHIPRVFSENANRAAFAVDKAIRADTGFTLVNEEAVRHVMEAGVFDTQLIREVVPDAPELGPAAIQSLRKREVDYPKDMRWNRQKFTSAITQGILQGESIPNIVKRTESIYGQNRNAAIRAARTAITNVENAGRMSSFERAQKLGIDMEIEWEATLDDRTRESHRMLDGERIQLGEYFETENGPIRWPGDPMADPAETWNCFIGETRAVPLGGVERSYRRFYDGPAVTVKTASGVEFTCTPNHPILTSEGWVCAGLLHDGDDLFLADLGNALEGVGIEPDVEHVGSRLDAVHELCRMLPCERASSVTVNFHEDVPACNVDVVSEERPLRVNLETLRLEPVDENILEPADTLAPGDGVLVVGGVAAVHPPDGVVSRLGESSALLGGSVRHALVHSLRAVPGRDSRALEPIRDGVATYAELFCESLDALSAVVKLDKVVEVEVKTISEHVYNLQTESGAYLVSGSDNGNVFVVSHNCRCRADGRVVGFDGERGDWADEEPGERWSRLPEGTTYEQWKAGKAVSRAESYGNEAGRVSGAWYVERAAETASAAAGSGFTGIAEGQDILGTWQRRPDQYDFEIEDVMAAQGFDGKPRIVDADKFDRAVREANGSKGLVMQRSYSAPDKATLDAYRDMLYDGKWYVDCSAGGSQYGQGMYAAADYTGKVTADMQREMRHYTTLNQGRLGAQPLSDEGKEAFLRKWVGENVAEADRDAAFTYLKFESHTGNVAWADVGKAVEHLGEEKRLSLLESGVHEDVHQMLDGHSYVETMTLDPSAKVITYDELKAEYARAGMDLQRARDKVVSRADYRYYDLGEITKDEYDRLIASQPTLPSDMGSYAASRGYDAINAEGHGESGSYTVVLNRTKLIIRRPE